MTYIVRKAYGENFYVVGAFCPDWEPLIDVETRELGFQWIHYLNGGDPVPFPSTKRPTKQLEPINEDDK